MILVKRALFRAARTFKMVRRTLLTMIYDRKYAKADKVSEQIFDGLDPEVLKELWANFDPKMAVGEFALTMANGQKQVLEFDSHNPQFHALYLDRYSQGYEPEVAEFIDAALGDRGVFCDVGANWGYFTLFAAVRPGFAGRVEAFEPGRSFQDLEALVKNAGLQSVVTCRRIALADSYERVNIESPEDRPIETGLGQTVPDEHGLIQAQPLDSLGLDALDVMKVDVESLEDQVFGGGEVTIRRHKPSIVFENTFKNMDVPVSVIAPLFRLEGWGYQLFAPAWLVTGRVLCPMIINGALSTSLVADNRAVTKFGADSFVLRAFQAKERLLLQRKINCIAVHKDRIRDLVERGQFSETETP